MAERKVKFKLGSEEVDAWDVPIEETTERWTEIKLEDGAVLRLKTVVGAVFRMDDKTDADGNPVYAIKSTNALVTVNGPEPKTNGRKG